MPSTFRAWRSVLCEMLALEGPRDLLVLEALADRSERFQVNQWMCFRMS